MNKFFPIIHKIISAMIVLGLLLSTTPTSTASPDASSRSAPTGLYRTRITLRHAADQTRLDKFGIMVLDEPSSRLIEGKQPTTAIVLVNEEQLETLARLRFEPQASDELGALVRAHAGENSWLAAILQPTLDQAAAIYQQQNVLRSNKQLAASYLAQQQAILQATLHTLSSDQTTALATLATVDDDGDGLTNTQEQWWCTDPNNADSDGDGVSDGAEVQSARDWLGNRRAGPPASGKPFAGWPLQISGCQDSDMDSVPDLAETWDLGLNPNRESTDRDKFDDGQELFGNTYCPGSGGYCGYGALPRNEDWGVIFAEMPAWVKAPGDHPFVAAYPVASIDVVPSSFHVETVTIVTTDHTISTGTEQSYSTSETKGTATSVSNTQTWNDWEEVTEGREEKETLLRHSTFEDPSSGDDSGGDGSSVLEGSPGQYSKFLRNVGAAASGPLLREVGGNMGGEVGQLIDDLPPQCINASVTIGGGVNVDGKLAGAGVGVEGHADAELFVNDTFWDQRCKKALKARGLYEEETINLYLDTSNLVRSIEGLERTMATGQQQIADRLYEVSAVLAAPINTKATTRGHSTGGSLTTTTEQYQEHTITRGEAFSSAESWSTATAVDSAHAADLWFTYQVRNTGTEYTRQVCNLAFNIYLNKDPNPVTTYFVGSDLGGNGCFQNLMPAEQHTYTSRRIPLSLEQMKAIDLGGSVRIVVEDYTYGMDELFYQDAVQAGIVIALEDGVADGDEAVDTYLLPTWGEETMLDVLARYFPNAADSDGSLIALWTPESSATSGLRAAQAQAAASAPAWCNEPRQVGGNWWCKHGLAVNAWWDIYLNGLGEGDEEFQDIPAAPAAVSLLRFNQDSDLDGYSDRSETEMGTDPKNAADYPYPRLIAGIHEIRYGNQVSATLSLINTGIYDAFAIEGIMIAADNSINITNNTVGGSGRVRASRSVIVGSQLEGPTYTSNTWLGTATPLVSGYYGGEQDKTFTFTALDNSRVGADTLQLQWDDGAGHTGILNFGTGYASPNMQMVGDSGIQVGLLSGNVTAGDKFLVTARTPRDVFAYTINREPHTEPIVIVSYNDPQGNKRFVTPLQLPYANAILNEYGSEMLPWMGVEIVSTEPYTQGINTTQIVAINPTDKTLVNSKLILEFWNITGTIASQVSTTVTLPPGPSTVPLAWNTVAFSPTFDAEQQYIAMAFWTDYQGNIVDTTGRSIANFQADPQPELATANLVWNLGAATQGTIIEKAFTIANAGFRGMHLYVDTGGASSVSTTGTPYAIIAPGDTRQVTLTLDTARLPAGVVNRQVILRTDDLDVPTLTIPINGTIAARSGDVVTAPTSSYRPWDESLTVFGPHNAGDVITYTYTPITITADIHPLAVYQDHKLVGIGPFGTAFKNDSDNLPSGFARPVGRSEHAAAFDSVRGVTLIFGGRDDQQQPLGDTWEWNGNLWQQRTSPNAPAPRYGHTMVYDSARGVVLLFGGRDDTTVFNDTWQWNGTQWSPLSPATSPSARYNYAMVYDSLRQRVVLFGGRDGQQYYRETWEWDGSTWALKPASSQPSTAYNHAAAYDEERGVTVYAYSSPGSSSWTHYVWEWDGSTWVQKRPTSGPTHLSNLVYDKTRDVTIATFGASVVGSNGVWQFKSLNEVWEWDGSTWNQQPSVPPYLGRSGHTLVYDDQRNCLVLFGGNWLDDTWEWDSGNGWTERTPATRPPAQDDFAMAYDSQRNVTVLFSSIDQNTWEWDGTTWVRRKPRNAPPISSRRAMAYDSQRGVVVLFGGQYFSNSETWEWNGSNWARRATSGPSQRSGHAMVYDSQRGVTVLFGGYYFDGSNSFFYNDTWEWNGTTWTNRAPSYKPQARHQHAMVYDSQRGVTVLFGGYYFDGSNSFFYNDTWEWNGSAWTRRGFGPPQARMFHAMAYDSMREETVLFGGWGTDSGGASIWLDDTWAWNGQNWTEQTPSIHPGERSAHRMAYDNHRHVTVLFGGYTYDPAQNKGIYLGDIWEWDGTRWWEGGVEPTEPYNINWASPGIVEYMLPSGIASDDQDRYRVQYGERGEYTNAGSRLFHAALPNQNYTDARLDLLLHKADMPFSTAVLDIGADNSIEWILDWASAPSIQSSTNLADGLNRFLENLAAPAGARVIVPISVTLDITGDLFLTGLVATPASKEDASAGEIRFSTNEPTEGDRVTVTAIISNTGEGALPAVTIAFLATMPDGKERYIGSDFIEDIPASSTSQASIQWKTLGFTGTSSVRVIADPYNRLGELDEDNNQVSANITILTRPDLSVLQITLSDDEPVVGQPITVTLTSRNAGQTAAEVHTTALYEDNPAGALLGDHVGSPLQGGLATTIAFTWVPTTTGLHRLFARADRDNTVNEYDESNNDAWRDVYVGFRSPLLLDSGNIPNDPAYTSALGYGYVDEGQPDVIAICGSLATNHEADIFHPLSLSPSDRTLRRDPGGQVIYRFDHLLPGHFYHLDVTLYECDQLGRQESIYVDGNRVAGPVDLQDGQPHRLTLLVDPALYADRTVIVSIQSPGVNGAIVSKVNLYDVDYRYADAGGSPDPTYPQSAIRDPQSYGWLDGVANTNWGNLPYQSVRIDQDDNEVRYRFDGLDPLKQYDLLLTFWQTATVGNLRSPAALASFAIQKVQIDSVDTGLTVDNADGQVHRETVPVPLSAYIDDGSIVAGVVRLNAIAGAMVNQIALEERTLTRQGQCEVQETPYSSDVYGGVAINGIVAPVNTVIQAFNPRGDVVGCFVVQAAGQYGFMRLYGEDTSASPLIPGMRDGELVSFRVNGALATSIPLLYWHDDHSPHRVDLNAGSIAGQSILLQPGWNLFSSRVESPVPLVSQSLSAIKGRYDLVLGEYGAYSPLISDTYNTLREMHAGPGYYIRITSTTSLNAFVQGANKPVTTPIPLHPGWNWIGYLPERTLPVTIALQSIAGHYQRVQSLDKTFDPALLPFSTLWEMEPGKGYLVYATDAITLTYPSESGMAAIQRTVETGKFTCGEASPTPYLTVVYGRVSVNGKLANAGTRIDVVTPRGEIAGCAIVQEAGKLKMMHIYGQDATATPPIGGFRAGEPLAFRVNGLPTQSTTPILWQSDRTPHVVTLSISIQQIYLPVVVRD